MKTKSRTSPVRRRVNHAVIKIRQDEPTHLQLRQPSTLTPAQEAQHITFTLQGFLKRSRLQFLIIATKLVDFKERKLYEALHYKTIEDYAEDRLGLHRSSLFLYLKIHAWVLEKHPLWLQPKPAGFIPDLYDCVDLMWIEHALDRRNLTPALKAALEALRKKALAGKLKKGDLDPYRRKKHDEEDGLKIILTQLLNVRSRCVRLAKFPEDSLANLDTTIASVRSHIANFLKKKFAHHP